MKKEVMMPRDLSEIRYTNADAIRATDINAGTLQTWLTREHVRPDQQLGSGQGTRRLYSARGIVRLALTQRLNDYGVPVARAQGIADVILTLGGRHLAKDPAWPGAAAYD